MTITLSLSLVVALLLVLAAGTVFMKLALWINTEWGVGTVPHPAAVAVLFAAIACVSVGGSVLFFAALHDVLAYWWLVA